MATWGFTAHSRLPGQGGRTTRRPAPLYGLACVQMPFSNLMAQGRKHPPPPAIFLLGFGGSCWDLPAGSTQEEEGEDLRDTPVLEKTDRGQHVSVVFPASGPPCSKPLAGQLLESFAGPFTPRFLRKIPALASLWTSCPTLLLVPGRRCLL